MIVGTVSCSVGRLLPLVAWDVPALRVNYYQVLLYCAAHNPPVVSMSWVMACRHFVVLEPRATLATA